MDISSTSSEDDLSRDTRHERRRIKSAPSSRRIQEDFVKHLSYIKLETPPSEIPTMSKTLPPKQANANPAATLATTQDAATPATAQATATPATIDTLQPIPETSRDAAFPTSYDPGQPSTLEDTKARFQMAAMSFSKTETYVLGLGSL